MIITINNFGPVRQCTLDLSKDFHLLVGKNNIGKSYAITAAYLIVKTFNEIGSNDIGYYSLGQMYFHSNLSLDDSLENILKTGENLKQGKEIEVTSLVKNMIKSTFQEQLSQQLLNSFVNTFNSLDYLKNRYNSESPTFSISSKNVRLDFTVTDKSIDVTNLEIDTIYYIKKIKQNRSPHIKDNKCTLYFNEGKEREFIQAFVVECLMRTIQGFISDFNSIINTVHYLPASRSGLYQALSAFGQIIAELSKNRSFLSKKIELPGISEPVSDYFIRLSDIKVRKRTYEDKTLNDLAKEIEDKILNGKVEFNSQTKQLMFYPNNTDLKLELSSTSSMVSELAPIVSYLRYVLTESGNKVILPPWVRRKRTRASNVRRPSHLIMIEEPEAHLHPEIQLLLTTIFAKLVKANVKLIITSHSNFIFNKVNNLIMSGDLKVDAVYAGVFKSTVTGAVVNSLEIDELGVEDDNFSDPTRILFEEKLDIIDKHNEEQEEA